MAWPIIQHELNTVNIGTNIRDTQFVTPRGKVVPAVLLPIAAVFYLPVNANMDVWPWCLAQPDLIAEKHKKSRPIFLVVPGKDIVCLQSIVHKEDGLTLVGELPNIKVLGMVTFGDYRGFIYDGFCNKSWLTGHTLDIRRTDNGFRDFEVIV